MDERDKHVIKKMYVRLDKNLEATPLLSYLYQEDALSEEDMDKISNKSTRKEKAEKLIKILKRRKHGLRMLIKALLLTKVQAFLGHELLEMVSWSEEEMKNFKLEVEGQNNSTEKLELELAALQQRYNQLEEKHEQMKTDYENEIAELKHRLEEQKQPNVHLSKSSSIFSWFKRSGQDKKDKQGTYQPNEEDDCIRRPEPIRLDGLETYLNLNEEGRRSEPRRGSTQETHLSEDIENDGSIHLPIQSFRRVEDLL